MNREPPEYITKIPRRAYGRQFIWWMFRRYCLNSARYKVTTRFTGPRPRGTNQISTLRCNATAYRHYIETRERFTTRVKRFDANIRRIRRLQNG